MSPTLLFVRFGLVMMTATATSTRTSTQPMPMIVVVSVMVSVMPPFLHFRIGIISSRQRVCRYLPTVTVVSPVRRSRSAPRRTPSPGRTSRIVIVTVHISVVNLAATWVIWNHIFRSNPDISSKCVYTGIGTVHFENDVLWKDFFFVCCYNGITVTLVCSCLVVPPFDLRSRRVFNVNGN